MFGEELKQCRRAPFLGPDDLRTDNTLATMHEDQRPGDCISRPSPAHEAGGRPLRAKTGLLPRWGIIAPPRPTAAVLLQEIDAFRLCNSGASSTVCVVLAFAWREYFLGRKVRCLTWLAH